MNEEERIESAYRAGRRQAYLEWILIYLPFIAAIVIGFINAE